MNWNRKTYHLVIRILLSIVDAREGERRGNSTSTSRKMFAVQLAIVMLEETPPPLLGLFEIESNVFRVLDVKPSVHSCFGGSPDLMNLLSQPHLFFTPMRWRFTLPFTLAQHPRAPVIKLVHIICRQRESFLVKNLALPTLLLVGSSLYLHF